MAFLDDDIVAYWKLDEASGDAADSVGSNTLTNNNTVAFTTGKLNNCADFESGSSESLSIADNAALSITGALTISMWVNHESLPAANATRTYAGKTDGANEISYRLAYRDDTAGSGNVGLTFFVSADGANIGGTPAIVNWVPDLATWYHIAVTYDPALGANDRVNLFINGENQTLDAGATIDASIFDGDAAFRLGADDTGLYYDGKMDEVGVWERALSPLEIMLLYNAGTPLAFAQFATTGEVGGFQIGMEVSPHTRALITSFFNLTNPNSTGQGVTPDFTNPDKSSTVSFTNTAKS